MQPPERRQLTVVMCDVVGWTALSLRLDPEDLTEVIQAYRQLCANLVTSHGGIVAQYVGDGVLAYFGYPRAHEDDAERAIRAALEIVAAPREPTSGVADLDVHIGIATGIVVVGDLAGHEKYAPSGSTDPLSREEVSAIGSPLNLAARLQALAASGTVVVSEQTRRLCRGMFEYRDLGRHAFKGCEEPVQVWQVLRECNVRSRFHALRASALTPLVDRRSEMQELSRLWNSAQAGQGRVLLVTAEPGCGKSRLVEEVEKRIVGPQCLRVWYCCTPHLQGSPLAPMIRHLRLAARFSDQDDDNAKLHKIERLLPAGAGDTREFVPLLANLLSIPYESRYPPLNMSAQRQKHRLFEVLMQTLEAAASARPFLLVVEDLHWADPSTDELIGQFIDRAERLPVLAILTARPEFQAHWDGKAHVRQMSLGPLSRRDSIEMIELLCGSRDLPEEAMSRIAEETDGLPLFIEDLTRDVLELADLQEAGSGATVPREPLPFPIPTTLTDSLMSRLDRLGSAKRVAQIGAAIGREFSYELLSRVAHLPEEDLKEELYRLVNAGLLTVRRSSAVLSYSFKHALIRDAASASLLKKAQVSLHARIAKTLVEDFPEIVEAQPEVLAYHFHAAKEVDTAVRYLVKAAKLSARRSGLVEAMTHLKGALSLLATRERTRSRMRQELRVYLALGAVTAEYRGFSCAESGEIYAAALELCHELGDALEIFPALSGMGSFELTRANFTKCRSLAEECLVLAEQRRFTSLAIMGHLLLGGTQCLTAEFSAARAQLEGAIAACERNQRLHRGRQVLYVQDQKLTGLCYLALTLTIMGHVDAGLRAAEEGLGHARLLGGPHTINYALCYLAAVHHIRGDAPAALERATASLEWAREQGFATWIGISQMIRGASLVTGGECEAGLEEIAAGIKAHSAMDAIAHQTFGIALYAQGLITTGRFDEALRVLTDAFAISERIGERFFLAELWRLQGLALAGKGERSQAEASLRQAIEVARRQEAKLFELRSAVSLCGLYDRLHGGSVRREFLQPVLDWFEEDADAPDLRDAKSLLAAAGGS
ncbi:AAA family ATPase [Aquisalimonas sp.]|uniref:AAA family ATPase n=1 Tax=Aquisalimonas sp. TaxID=1872621 RepID=UPI0025B82F9A|nr:AAA family ATPase [Aquisalimonas sp.]